ncbi:MAG: PilZ domain-containing protein [Wenzhouxiangella sp.]
MGQDRRQFQRVPYECTALLFWEGREPVGVEVENLSLKGVLLHGLPKGQGPVPGQAAQLEIRLGPEAAMNMALEIAFVDGTRVGASWVEIDIDGMTHLRRLLALNLGDAELVDAELARMLHPDS